MWQFLETNPASIAMVIIYIKLFSTTSYKLKAVTHKLKSANFNVTCTCKSCVCVYMYITSWIITSAIYANWHFNFGWFCDGCLQYLRTGEERLKSNYHGNWGWVCFKKPPHDLITAKDTLDLQTLPRFCPTTTSILDLGTTDLFK